MFNWFLVGLTVIFMVLTIYVVKTNSSMITIFVSKSDKQVEQLQEEQLILRSQVYDLQHSLKVARSIHEYDRRDVFKSIYRDYKKAVFFIRVEYGVKRTHSPEIKIIPSFGTGFFIRPDGVAVTALHVLYPWQYDKRFLILDQLGRVTKTDHWKISIWMYDKEVNEETFMGQYERKDLKILHKGKQVFKTQFGESPFGVTFYNYPELEKTSDIVVFQIIDFKRKFPYIPLPISKVRLNEFDKVMSMGFPFARLKNGKTIPQPTKGFIRRLDSDSLETDISLHPGSSGGPVFDDSGRFVGVASALIDNKPTYSISTKVDDVQNAWKEIRREFRIKQRQVKRIGCDPGPIDGIPGKRTWKAIRECILQQ
jgi:V8-like Glu-specific endopeptidase